MKKKTAPAPRKRGPRPLPPTERASTVTRLSLGSRADFADLCSTTPWRDAILALADQLGITHSRLIMDSLSKNYPQHFAHLKESHSVQK